MPRAFHSEGVHSGALQRVFIAVPSYGPLPVVFVHSLWSCHTALRAAGIDADLAIMSGNCHVDDARNYLVRDFLERGCTDLVFIDADVGFDCVDLVRLLGYDRDVVAGVYPMKQTPEEYPVIPIEGEIQADADGLVEVAGVPTGFLRIRRAVLEAMAERAPKFRARTEPMERRPIPVIFERTLLEGAARYSGDYTFCRKWRAMGGRIHVAPEMAFEHSGDHSWCGSLGAFWRRQHGVAESRFASALQRIRSGAETERDIAALVEYWGNQPWAAGGDLLAAWIMLARDADGDILECGSGLTTLVAAAANPAARVWSLDHDMVWAARTRALAAKHGLSNVRIADTTLENGWYVVPDEFPIAFGLVLVDGPPRQASDRAGLLYAGLDLDEAVVVWDDADQTVMTDMIAAFCAHYSDAAPTVFKNGPKPFAVAKLGRRVPLAAE